MILSKYMALQPNYCPLMSMVFKVLKQVNYTIGLFIEEVVILNVYIY